MTCLLYEQRIPCDLYKCCVLWLYDVYYVMLCCLKGELKPYSHFLLRFAASSGLRKSLSSPTEHHLCIQACWATHAAYACMLNRLQHNRLALHYAKSLNFTLPLLRAKVSQCSIASHLHLSSQQQDPCIVLSSHVLGQLNHLGLLEHICWKLTMCWLSHWDISNIHPSMFSLGIGLSVSMLDPIYDIWFK